MKRNQELRCYGSIGVGPDDRFYTRCDACGWRGPVFEADQYDDALAEAERHSDPELLKEQADWVRMLTEQRDDSHFPHADLEDPIEDTNS